MLRWVSRILLLVLVLTFVGVGAAYVYLRQSLPQTSGTVTLQGLAKPVEIVRDREGIPHIHAQSEADAYFALGFVHAQDRLWLLETNRRIAAGRLAETFGETALATDKFLRTIGIRRIAEATWAELDAPTRAIYEAYAAGVNAFLSDRTGALPIEFLLTGVTPEPWTPVDSLGWLKMMAWDLSGNWNNEVMRARMTGKLTPRQIAEFFAPYPGDAPVALSDLGGLYAPLMPALARLADVAPASLPEGAGSNNWVLAGRFSATGKPLLANDPHLGLSTPSIWYFANLQAPGLRVIGATLPGIPAVVLGRNSRIAWGFTTTNADTQDLFVEKIDPADSQRYIAPDGPRPFETVEERIAVKGQADVVISVRRTRHGPVISDHLPAAAEAAGVSHVLSFAWTALRPDDRTASAGLMLARAGNWAEFLAAAELFHAPQQNVVYADIDGNIGFIAPARVPLRRADNDIKGMMPAPGWDARYDWQGFIPFNELPRAFNPANGRIVTANHKIVPDSYPHHISVEWAEPYRARRIEQLLAARPTHSLQSFMDLQADTRSLMVDEMLPLLVAAPPVNERAARAIAMIKAWDGNMAGNRPEPLIVKAWLRELGPLIYRDELGPDLFAAARGERPLFVLNVLRDVDGQSRWCDDATTGAKSPCAALIARALDQALTDLERRYGADAANWKWDEAHAAVGEHRPFSRVKLLQPLFEVRVPTPGDTYSVNVGRHDNRNEAEPFANRHAAALRAIYDFADLDRSLWMHSTGQSGNRLSPFYGNLAKRWAKVEYLPMSMRRADAEAGQTGTLVLQPR